MKLRSALPKQELNGLVAVHNDAIGHVGKRYLVVGVVEVEESTTRKDKTREAKFTLTRLEVVDATAAPYVAEVLEQTFEQRTGKTALDLDMPDVEDLRKRYRPKAGAPAEPTLLREPEALTASPTLNIDPNVLAPDETGDEAEGDDIVDAEVVDETPVWERAGSGSSDEPDVEPEDEVPPAPRDPMWDDEAPAVGAGYAGEPAESGADEADEIDVRGRSLTVDERTTVLDELGLDDEVPTRDFALAIQEAAEEAGLDIDTWVNGVLRAARDRAASNA